MNERFNKEVKNLTLQLWSNIALSLLFIVVSCYIVFQTWGKTIALATIFVATIYFTSSSFLVLIKLSLIAKYKAALLNQNDEAIFIWGRLYYWLKINGVTGTFSKLNVPISDTLIFEDIKRIK